MWSIWYLLPFSNFTVKIFERFLPLYISSVASRMPLNFAWPLSSFNSIDFLMTLRTSSAVMRPSLSSVRNQSGKPSGKMLPKSSLGLFGSFLGEGGGGGDGLEITVEILPSLL